MPVTINGTSGVTTPSIDAAAGNADLTTLSVAGNEISAVNSLGFRNRIINGDMRIDQRNAGASVTPTSDGTYTLDRWLIRNYGGSGRFSVQQVSSSVSGFTNAAKLTVTTTESPGTYGYAFSQRIEGFNFADFGFGTASAKAITISFWVQSSVTGTYCVSARNENATRSYIAEFSIASANTYEYKTITIPGDTSGTWSTTNTAGIILEWSLGAQTGKQSTSGSWLSGNYVNTSNQVPWINNSGATFYITGVQLEAGSVATPFERRPYGTELALCQRYFINWVGNSSGTGFLAIGTGVVNAPTQGVLSIPTPVTLRATPTVSFSGTISSFDGSVSPSLTAVSVVYDRGANGFWVSVTASSGGMTGGRGFFVYTANASTNVLSASAEL